MSAHPIQVAARRTGLTVDTLRAWEKRYAAVTPQRGENGRRIYTDGDLERLLLLRRLTNGGRRIGEVASLATDELRTMAARDNDAVESVPRLAPRTGAAAMRAEMLDAIRSLDTVRLDGLLERAQVELGTGPLVVSLLAPLMEEIGQRWQDGQLRIVHEHLATAAVRTLAQTLATSQPGVSGAPVAIVTTPSGQHHEIGALMAGVLATTRGWRVVYLGPDLPAEEIAAAAAQTEARAVILSVVYPSDDPALAREIRRLRRLLAPELPILIGGRASGAYEAALADCGVHRVPGIADVGATLDGLRGI